MSELEVRLDGLAVALPELAVQKIAEEVRIAPGFSGRLLNKPDPDGSGQQ